MGESGRWQARAGQVGKVRVALLGGWGPTLPRWLHKPMNCLRMVALPILPTSRSPETPSLFFLLSHLSPSLVLALFLPPSLLSSPSLSLPLSRLLPTPSLWLSLCLSLCLFLSLSLHPSIHSSLAYMHPAAKISAVIGRDLN